MSERPPAPTHQRAQGRIARGLAEVGFALPGTLLRRGTRCGKPGCRCMADPPQLHGPYNLWTRKVEGKTVNRRLTDEQVQRYQPWFDNWRRLRDLVAELQEVSLRAIEEAEGWDETSRDQRQRRR